MLDGDNISVLEKNTIDFGVECGCHDITNTLIEIIYPIIRTYIRGWGRGWFKKIASLDNSDLLHHYELWKG